MALKRIEPMEIDEDGDLVINTSWDYDWSDWAKISRLEKQAAEGDKEAQEMLDTYYPNRHEDEPEPKYEEVEDIDF